MSMLDKFKGNIYYSEGLQSLFIVIGIIEDDVVEIKLLNKPDFGTSTRRKLPNGHATTTIASMNEREPVNKSFLEFVKYHIVPKS